MSRRLAGWIVLAWLSGGFAFFPALASAQDEDAADDRAQSFQAVSGGVQEDIDGGPLMLAAYAAVWIAVFGYVYRINRLQRGVEDNLERLERSIARQGTASS